jgi:hypothetical protein
MQKIIENEIEQYIAQTTPEEVLAVLLEHNKTILQIGGTERLNSLLPNSGYHHIKSDEVDSVTIPEEKFDYIILTDVLELVDDPKSLIKKFKNTGKSLVIYEFKYDEHCKVEANWKQPWKSVGLEYFLSQEFDYLNSVFLGYATVHTCDTPFERAEEE